MKTTIDWLLMALGAVAALFGLYAMWTGSDIIQVERGWSHFIAGAALVSGGLVTIAVVWASIRLRGLMSSLTLATAVAEEYDQAPPAPAAPHVGPGAAAAGMAAGAVAGAALAEATHAHAAEEPPEPEPQAAPEEPARRFDAFTPFPHARQPAGDYVEPSIEREVESFRDEFLADAPKERRPTVEDLFANVSAPQVEPPQVELPQVEPHQVDLPPVDADIGDLDLEPPTPIREPLPLGLRDEPAAEHEEPAPPAVEIVSEESLLFEEIVEPAPVAETEAPYEPESPPLEPGDEDDWLAETARSLDQELGRTSEPPPPEPVEIEEPGREPSFQPEAKIIGRYTSGDTNYTMYSDGSIEAQTPDGSMRFASLVELRRFVEQRK